MRQLKGIPLNSSDSIIGKIIKSPIKRKEAKSCILLTSYLDKRQRRFKAILTSSEIEKEKAKRLKIPIIHKVEGIESLSEGDIVLLDMNEGNIIVEYGGGSIHNSIIATNKCNCRCIMCPQPSTEDPHEILKTNLEIIRLMDKTTAALGITGGEPTILRDGLMKILKQCKRYLPNTQIQVLTNGILLKNNDYIKRIAQLNIENLVFCVPIYADTDLEHDYIVQRDGAFEDTIHGLYNLAVNKQIVEIRIVVMCLNYKRLPQIAEFIYHNLPFAIHVAFMGMEVEGEAKNNIKKLWISPKEYSSYLKKAVLYLSQRDMNVSIYNEQLCLLPKELWNFTCKSISEWKNTYLDKCTGCSERDRCGGFFAFIPNEHKKLIQPFNWELNS